MGHGCNIVSTHKSNGLIRFFDALNYFASIKLFKELNHSVVPYFSAKISSLQRNHNYPTRFTTNHNLIPPRFVKTKCQSSFIFQSIAFWNTLPVEIKLCTNSKAFKYKLKLYIISNYL